MISPFRKALCATIIALGSTSIALAQSTFFEVPSTPYDHQMQRIQPALNAPSVYTVYAPSLDVVNGWMTALRMMPYQYSHQWRTPYEVEMERAGDCKGKAMVLYGWMRSRGANNVRLVIGKRRAEDSLTHAWLEWDTTAGTFLLDPTFNWTASIKVQDPVTYVAFYGYGGGHKYRASKSRLANRTLATPNPAAPAHGAITRPVQSTWQPYSAYPTVSANTINPRTFSNRASSSGSRAPQRNVHNLRRSVHSQRKPISNPVRNDKLARPAFVQAGPITK